MLVIFDCDGVLVDSEALAAEIFAQTLQLNNVPYSAQDCRAQFVGLTLDVCIHRLREQGFALPKDFKSQLFEKENTVFARKLKPVDGIKQVITTLVDHQIPFCVASNGSLAKIVRSLKIVRLFPFFDGRIYSAQQVEKGKPAPDLFLLAAESMGVLPNHCVVVEDSVAGVRAAVAAGMMVLRYGEEVAHMAQGRALIQMQNLPEAIKLTQ